MAMWDYIRAHVLLKVEYDIIKACNLENIGYNERTG